MQKLKTFVILSPGFPRDEADSTCLPAQQAFVLALKNDFPSIKIVVFSFQYPHSPKPYTWKGVDVIPFNGRGRAKFFRLFLWKKVWSALKRLKDENELLGILSLWFGECALVGKNFSKMHNVKHKIWILGQDAKKENKYPGRTHLKEDELIALSDFLQDEFERNHDIRPHYVVPPGIDTTQFTTNEIASLKLNLCSCALSIAANHSPSSAKSANAIVPSLSGSWLAGYLKIFPISEFLNIEV